MLSRISMRVLSLRQPAKGDDLLARVQRGEVSAVGELYDAHHEALRAFCRRLLGDDSAAEDLVHEVFVELPSLAARFRGDSSLRTFLIGIAVNHARHHVRSAARRRAAMSRLAEQPTAHVPGPEEETERTRLVTAVQRGLDTLPIDQRVAFVLCDVEERGSPEVASILSVPEATVRTRLHHARKRLREHLAKEGFR
jgi:RNA polymerase sigma-70 factor, ECF subfamily